MAKTSKAESETAGGRAAPSGLRVEGAPPPFYKSLTLLEAGPHGGLALAARRDYGFLRQAQTLPLTAEEIPAAQRDFPVIFSEGESPTPLAVLSARGADAYLDEDGGWRAGTHFPAYLRRHPFALARFGSDPKRKALCADLESGALTEDADASEERRLFSDGKPTALAQEAMKLCEAFDVAVARTETLCRRLSELGVFERRSIQVAAPEGTREFRGLVVISEAKLWALDDATLAALARSGALTIALAHLMSIANFRYAPSPKAI